MQIVRSLFSGTRPLWLMLGVLWLIGWSVLRLEWGANPQYAYGWSIPLLALALGWLRWERRPFAPVPAAARARRWLLAAALLLLLFHAPIRWVQIATPEWRTLLWIQAFQLAGLTALAFVALGGWRAARWLAFPLALTFLAVPWPSNPETWLVQRLMQGVAAVTVELLNLTGTPALRHGNLVEIATGTVGVAEACSGIRSLQTNLMFALVLGELARFGSLRRWLLVGGGLLVALVANIGRTGFLVKMAAAQGIESLHRWHDAAGAGEFIACGALMLGLAWLLEKIPAPGQRAIGDAVGEPTPPPASDAAATAPDFLPRILLVAAAVWIAAVELGVELWYRAHERALPPPVEWTVKLPAPGMRDFRSEPVPEETQAILRADEGQCANWRDDAGRVWRLFYFRWRPGHASVRNAEVHRPEICLPALDLRKTGDFGVITTAAAGLPLPFHHTRFESPNGRPLEIFYALISDRPAANDAPFTTDRSAWSRLEAALAGRRNQGQRLLELAVADSAALPSEAGAPSLRHLQEIIQTIVATE